MWLQMISTHVFMLYVVIGHDRDMAPVC